MTTDAFKDLRTWATVRQLEFIEAIEKHGSKRGAAKALGLTESTVRNSLQSLAKRAARMGALCRSPVQRLYPNGQPRRGAGVG
jgi:hypothetical protein